MTQVPVQTAMETLATALGTKIKTKADAAAVDSLASRVTAAEATLAQQAADVIDMGPILAALD